MPRMSDVAILTLAEQVSDHRIPCGLPGSYVVLVPSREFSALAQCYRRYALVR
jgi:hypothetical protein